MMLESNSGNLGPRDLRAGLRRILGVGPLRKPHAEAELITQRVR